MNDDILEIFFVRCLQSNARWVHEVAEGNCKKTRY
jgi:hypothetical protein